MALRFLSLAAGSRIIVCTHSKICTRANEPSTGTHKNQSKFSKSTCDIETISKDSSQPACCFSFWDYPKDLQGYLDPRGAAKHGRMPRERWQRLISQSVNPSVFLWTANHLDICKSYQDTQNIHQFESLKGRRSVNNFRDYLISKWLDLVTLIMVYTLQQNATNAVFGRFNETYQDQD